MAFCIPPASIRHPNPSTNSPILPWFRFLSCNYSTSRFLSASLLFSRPPQSLTLRRQCGATTPRPPSPPESEPPPRKDLSSSPGLLPTFSRFQETVQIFFAVLFWMSLFFWASLWDRRNNGRSDKGPRFRR